MNFPLDIFRYLSNYQIMETENAIEAFNALAQETRLSVFRLLVTAGSDGLPAGAIAKQLSAAPSTLSHHLSLLERAGLLRSWRVQRQIFYATDYEGVRQVLSFLMEDCCNGRPEICGQLPGQTLN
jgi:ArsR family transcriptional regulator, arsenate/arsenite/antimonite-responsive transcriptional repressor